MVVDSSAFIAIATHEEGYEQLVARAVSELCVMGAPTLLEASIVLTYRFGIDTKAVVSIVLSELSIQVVDFSPEHVRAAYEAFLTYGKGRHPAKLNYGDCMTYGLAKLRNEAILYVGNDFAKTDLGAV